MFEREHTALYAAFDRFPSRKGAAIHIDRFARTLSSEHGGGALLVLGGGGLPAHQLEGGVEIVRFARPIENYLERALAFERWVSAAIDRLAGTLELCHFRDPWSGLPIALRPRRRYGVVYEVNALPSIELPSLYPDLGPRTIDAIRDRELACCEAADRIITPSATTASLLATLGIREAKIRVIPNGADVPPPCARPLDLPYLLYFGAAQRWQGIDTLVRAFARLADFHDLRLVICASHESKAWKPYEKLADRLGVAERMVWRYSLDEPELAAWRQHAFVSVAPLSECPRNVLQGCAPLKILESMASGVAVVASDVPPVREIITDRHDGWLVHPDRPAELARAIRLLLDHPETARELGANARRTIEARFTWARATEALRDEYRQWKGAPADECMAAAPIAQ